MKFAKDIVSKLQKLLGRRSEPQDPYAYVGARIKSGPGGRFAAIALEEPQSRRVLNVFGRREPR